MIVSVVQGHIYILWNGPPQRFASASVLPPWLIRKSNQFEWIISKNRFKRTIRTWIGHHLSDVLKLPGRNRGRKMAATDRSRSEAAKQRRQDQLQRWQGSETDRTGAEARSHSSAPGNRRARVRFAQGAVFMAACSAGDRDEVAELLRQGADINHANIDGLTAMHQVSGACLLVHTQVWLGLETFAKVHKLFSTPFLTCGSMTSKDDKQEKTLEHLVYICQKFDLCVHFFS